MSETIYLTWPKDRAATRPAAVFRLTFSRRSLRGEKWQATDRKWGECGLLVITYMSDGLWPTFREITRREAEAIIRRERRRRSRFCWMDDDAIEVERRRG